MNNPNLLSTVGPQRPTVLSAHGCWVHTIDGRRFLDGSSGPLAVNLGYGNQRVLAAMAAQMEATTFAYRTHFVSEATEGLAADLAAFLPGDLNRVFFTSGGSESVEAAVKLARHRAVAIGEGERTVVISLDPSYHGATFGALALTGHAARTGPYQPMLFEHSRIPAPRPYLPNEIGADGAAWARLLADEIDRIGPGRVLAFIVEPVGGAATGANVAPDGYLAAVRRICDDNGVVLIADEVMTGLGRCGQRLACEQWGVQPDIVAVSKGLGAGYVPLGAIATTEAMAEPLHGVGGFAHGHTYAGNPLACAAGRAVLAEIVDHDLVAAARRIGERLAAGLAEVAERHPIIGHVRGLGALWAIELVADRATMAVLPPADNTADRLAELCYQRELILYPGRCRGGRAGDHLLVGPPLIADDQELDRLLGRLDDALAALVR